MPNSQNLEPQKNSNNLFEVVTIGNVTVVGETKHDNTVDEYSSSTEAAADLLKYIGAAEQIILEHKPPATDAFGKRVFSCMRTAVRCATDATPSKLEYLLSPEGGFPLDEIIHEYKACGVDVVGEKFVLAVEVIKFMPLFFQQTNMDMTEMIKGLIKKRSGKQLQVAEVTEILELSVAISKNLIMSQHILAIDATIRERLMQSRLSQIDKDATALIIVGHSHLDGIVNAIKSPEYRTPLTANQREVLARVAVLGAPAHV